LNLIPHTLQHVADLVRAGADKAQEPTLEETPPARHALQRLDLGYDIVTVVTEYAILRQTILELWEMERQASARPGELRLMNRMLDHAIASSVHSYTKARHRTLEALDRVSVLALVSGDLEEFLPKLLNVVLETTHAVDTVAVLLREDDRLRMRAAVGLEEAVAQGFTVEIGEGF